MKRLKGKSVLYSYLISFVSIAMLCCVLIGLIGYLTAARELRKTTEEAQQKRLMLAAEDMSAQFEHLQEISYLIQTTECYQPYFIVRNPWYEVEMLKDLKKFANYSALYDQYFLRYEGENDIYIKTGKSFLSYYAQTRLGHGQIEELSKALDDCKEVTFFPLSKGSLLIFPIRMAPLTAYSGRATMSFLLTRERLVSRAQLVSGEKFTHMALYYNDQCVIDCAAIQNPLSVTHGAFTMVFDKDEIGVAANGHFFTLNLWITMAMAALLCLLAAFVAVRNYRPIANLARRHNIQGGSNELEHLDQTLIDMEGKLRISQGQLDERVEQFKALRSVLQRHFVWQMVHGNVDDAALGRMSEAGLHFPGRLFYAFILRPAQPVAYETLEKAIAELTDDRTAFYVAPFGGENSYAVVVNSNEGGDLQDILLDACTDAQVFGGKETEVISEIPSLLFDAMTETSPSCIRPSDIARCREDERLRKFRKALEIGDETLALESLNEYCAAYAGGDETISRLIHNNLIAVLLSASYEANMSVPHAFLRGKLESWPMLEGWVSALCNSKDNLTQSDEHQIIRYLREHMLDYHLSLESVAEHFHRSTRQITRIIQAETGGSYKEFILRLRMEYAKEMLAAGKSVAETCEAVCYVSRSHFIKTFTNYTGMTPSRFREQEMKTE